MPSGSKKRKSSKKSQPQGDPPELEAGLGEAMGNAREEVEEAIPSPKGIQGDPEAIAERGLDGNGVNGEFLQERDAEPEPPKEDFQTDEAVPAQDAANQGDPPSQAEPEPEIPAVNELGGETAQRGTGLQVETPFEESAAPPVIEPGAEIAQRETEPQIDAPFEESEAKTDATPEEIKPEVESLSVADAPPDTSPDEIKPDADIVLDEVESSKELTQLEREFGPDAAMEESFVKSEMKTDAASSDIEPPIDQASDEYKPEMDVPVDATPYIELEAIEAPEQVPEEAEPATDEAPAEIKPESLVEEQKTAEPPNSELENEEAPLDRELVTDVPPTDVATETEVTEEPERAAAAEIEPGTEEVPVERELVTDVAPTDVETDLGETQIEEPEAAAPVDIKPETKDAPMEEIQSERELSTHAVEESPPEREVAIDATTADVVPEMDAALADTKAETVAPVDIEPETEEALMEETPAEGKLETDVVEEFPLERELAIDATAVDVEPETNATAADIKAEMDTAQVQTDSLQEEAPSEIDAARPENESDRDVAAEEIESEADAAAAVVESEPPTEGSPVEIELDADATLDKTEQDEVSQAEIEATPEPEPEVEALVEGEPEVCAEDVAASEPEPKAVALVKGEPETNAEDVDVSTAIEAKMEPPEEVEPLDLTEATLEPPQIIEPELVAKATDEAKPGDEALVGTSLEDRGSVEGEVEAVPEIHPEPEVATTHGIELEDGAEAPSEAKPELVVEALAEAELDEKGLIETEPVQQDLAETKPDQSGVKEDDRGSVEGEEEAPQEIHPEPEVATTRGIELEDEAEAPPEAKPELVVEAPAEAELDENRLIETEPVQQDLAETKLDQSGVEEDDQQLEKQEVEAGIGELGASASEYNQPSEPQPQVADASEVPVAEDEPPAISAFNEANLVDDSTSSTSSSETSNDTDKEGPAIEQEPEEDDNIPPSATTLEGEGESTIEVASENQDSGGDIEQTFATAVDNEQGTADELPAESREDISKEQERAVDVEHDDGVTVVVSSANGSATGEQGLPTELPLADVEESSKVAVSEQERAVDVGHGEDGAALEPAENGGEVEVSSGQELDIELPTADVVDVEEFAKEGPPPSDQELTNEQLQPLIDEQDMSIGLAAAAEPPSVEFDHSLNTTLPSSESKMTSDAPEPQDEVVAPTNDEKFTLEHERNLEAATCEVERDNGEDEAASSTVAEAGSVFNDFDERASCEQELPMDFPSADQDVDIPECKASDGDSSTEAPDFIETGLREQFDSEPSPAEKVDATAVCGLEDTSEQPEALLESAQAAKPAEDSHPAPIEETPSDELLSRLPQPEQVVQDSGRDEVSSSKEDKLANEEPNITEEERTSGEDDKAATNSILGTPFPNAAGDELISKALTYMGNGKQSSEAPSNELGKHRDKPSIQNSEANNMDNAEIHAMYSKEWKEAEDRPMGVDAKKDVGDGPVESAPLISEDRDIKDVYRQQSTQEASLPVVISGQDRDLEHVNVKNAERPSGGGILQRRTKLLDCCGMFDLLLRKN